ncbi:carbon-nitrogen hydrolase family protein [Solimonas sp. K1W22B-7]|uniref:carbon-nitrogen hydrolase family protein n=1 Tax=Solimonas sp. K1W22B-7 TaxID=2303331 RepID=UPI0013C5005E|nr:carbon-nitrogen hydrolase family protein [Solimonas sp. K1W22B-7]
MNSASPMKVAAVQMQGRPGDFAGNLRSARDYAGQAFADGARIVALPEFFASPVYYDEPFADQALDADDNPALEMMRDLARRHRGYIGGSVVLRRGQGVFNTYFFVQPDGSYRMHDKDLPTMWENCFYEPGQDDGCMDTDLGGVGAAVCWELIRTQTVQRLRGRIGLAMTGNHWWTIPSNWPLLTPLLRGLDRVNRGFSEQAPVEFAKRLGVPVLHASHCGRFRSRFLLLPGTRVSVPHESEFVGATQIVDARGQVLARRTTREGPGIVSAEIHLGAQPPVAALDEGRYWIPPLTLLHRAYWHQQNACGKSFYRQRQQAAGR